MKVYFYLICYCLLFFNTNAQYSTEFPMNRVPISEWRISGTGWQRAKDFMVFPDFKKFKLESGNEVLFSKKNGGVVSFDLKVNDFKVKFEFILNSSSEAIFVFKGLNISLKNTSSAQPVGTILKDDGNIILPLKNASKADKLWQKIEIIYSSKKEVKRGIIEKVVLNGLTIHENVFLQETKSLENNTPTFSFINQKGEFAFRNFEYLNYSSEKPISINSLSYQIQETFDWGKNFEIKNTPIVKGKSDELTALVPNDFNNFILTYKGKMEVKKTDKYSLTLDYMGVASLKIDGKEIVGSKEYLYRIPQTAIIELKKGEHDFEYQYQRLWWRPALGLFVSSATVRPYPLHASNTLPVPDMVGEYIVNPTAKTEMIRSFMMFNGKKKTKVISVGFPDNTNSNSRINYSFDLDQGTLLYAWKGDFADVTEMWHERGEPQIIKPIGLQTKFDGKPNLIIGSNPSVDSLNYEKDLIYKGYQLDTFGNPIYLYNFKNSKIFIQYNKKGNLLNCSIKASQGSNLNYKIISGKFISKLDKFSYLVDDKFIYFNPKSNPIIQRKTIDGEELIMSLKNPINYSIAW